MLMDVITNDFIFYCKNTKFTSEIITDLHLTSHSLKKKTTKRKKTCWTQWVRVRSRCLLEPAYLGHCTCPYSP